MRPKIKPENLFLLLEVGLPSEAWQAEAIDYATNDELLPALVSFFARTAETTLARGLFHHYRHEEDDLLALRGRIDFVRQFRRGGVPVPMACSWDDFTADVDENRCLTAAVRMALRVPDVPHDDRRRLRRLLAALDGVAEPTVTMALDSLDRIQYRREIVGVADLKYKLAEADTSTTGAAGPLARPRDYYQLQAYTTALKLSEGTLIYCADVNRDGPGELDGRTDFERFDSSADEASSCDDAVATLATSTVTVRHAGTRLHAVAVDLSGTPSDIDVQIAALACHFEATTGVSAR